MKKKVNYKIFGLFVLAFLFQNCKKDVLETVPNDRVSSAIYWKTEADAKSAVNSVYQALDAVNFFVLDGKPHVLIVYQFLVRLHSNLAVLAHQIQKYH